MWKWISATLLATTTMAGIYAASAASARNLTATFSGTQTASRERNVEFQGSARRSSMEREAAHSKCEILTGDEKPACRREARQNEPRSFRAAQR